ncbi:MAG: HNH/ENDO VII family nuclease [Terrimicrobiaceae bacterium]|nr:hypothetical protein [Terrimicrobiaceae bacterium]
MTAAKKIILALWVVVLGVVTAPANVPRVSENRTWEKIAPALELRQAVALQASEMHQDEERWRFQLVSDPPIDPDGRFGKGVGGGYALGDFYQPTNAIQGVGHFVGQVGAGLTPYWGQVADVRDVVGSVNTVRTTGLSFGTGAGVVLSIAAFVPGAGDAAKGILKPIANAVSPYVDNAWRAATNLFKNTPAAKTTGPVRNVAQFEGMEVRAVRDLSHLDDAALRAMVDDGTAAASRSGDKLILHHLNQSPAGPLVEIPRPFHSTGNRIQHPLGTAPGVGLTKAERAAHNALRERYWSWRAEEELARRGAQ